MNYKRNCDGCTKCCEGWLPDIVYENKMYQGRPCHFKRKNGCGIYKNRPNKPCKEYNCEWLKYTRIPEWFKPSETGILLTGREINKIAYLEITEAGSSLTIEMLNWLFQLHLKTGTNMYYEIKGGWNWMGTPEFCREMQIKHEK